MSAEVVFQAIEAIAVVIAVGFAILQVRQCLERACSRVKAWISGHKLAGDIACRKSTIFFSVDGFVESGHSTVYSYVELREEEFEVHGFDSQASHNCRLTLRPRSNINSSSCGGL